MLVVVTALLLLVSNHDDEWLRPASNEQDSSIILLGKLKTLTSASAWINCKNVCQLGWYNVRQHWLFVHDTIPFGHARVLQIILLTMPVLDNDPINQRYCPRNDVTLLT